MTTIERPRVRRDHRPERLLETLWLSATEGLTYAAIGRRIGITETGVKERMRDLFDQLGARTAPHAVHICYQRGYFPLKEAPSARR